MDSVYVPWFFTMGVSPFGNLRIEAYLQLPAAYRSLSRPSSAPDAKAFTLCSCSLELIFMLVLLSTNCLSFIKQIIVIRFLSSVKRFDPFHFRLIYSTFRWNCNFLPKFGKTINWFSCISLNLYNCPLICSFLTLQYSLFGFQWT